MFSFSLFLIKIKKKFINQLHGIFSNMKNKKVLILGSSIENNSASSVITHYTTISLSKLIHTQKKDIKAENLFFIENKKLNFEPDDFDYIIICYFNGLYEKIKDFCHEIKKNFSGKLYFNWLWGNDDSIFDNSFVALKEYLRNDKDVFVGRGADLELLNINQKNKIPTIFIDYDVRREEKANVDNVLSACEELKKEINIKVILIEKKDPRADFCLIEKIPFNEIWKIFNESWIYVTHITSTYELPVIENQMAGNYVISIDNCVKDELIDKGRTGFVVKDNKDYIKKQLKSIIENYNSNIPREFAIKNFNWDLVAQRIFNHLS